MQLLKMSPVFLALALSACGPSPATPSPQPSASASAQTGSSARIWTEAEVEAGLTCFENSGDVQLKVSGGQLRFGFENYKRNKALLGAEGYQSSLNTTGNTMLQLQASSTAACVK